MELAPRVVWRLHQDCHGTLGSLANVQHDLGHKRVVWTAIATVSFTLATVMHPLVFLPTCVFKLKHTDRHIMVLIVLIHVACMSQMHLNRTCQTHGPDNGNMKLLWMDNLYLTMRLVALGCLCALSQVQLGFAVCVF